MTDPEDHAYQGDGTNGCSQCYQPMNAHVLWEPLDDIQEERIQVILAVHNGLVTNPGQPTEALMFVRHSYSVPISNLLYIQQYLDEFSI